MSTIERSKKRINKTGEIFTPSWLTNEMLNLLPKDIWNSDKTFLDPAAGDGNILLEVLKLKIRAGCHPIVALYTIYGVELMSDNVKECKRRLLTEVLNNLSSTQKSKLITKRLLKMILNNNIKCANSLTFNYEKWKQFDLKKFKYENKIRFNKTDLKV